MRAFKLDINLDDENEVTEFIATHKIATGRALANRLGLKGEGSTRLATALNNYARNKTTAIHLRKSGRIETAMVYENICDRIYREDINPVCECW